MAPQEPSGLRPKTKQRMKTAGTVLTITGICVGAIGGAILGAFAAEEPSTMSLEGFGNTLGLGIGVAFTALGGASILVGVPLWVVGAN